MYTIGVYAVCVGLIFMIGAILFTGCAALLVLRDVCLMLLNMTDRILVRVRISAPRMVAFHPLFRLEGPHRRQWTRAVVSHSAVLGRSLIRMR